MNKLINAIMDSLVSIGIYTFAVSVILIMLTVRYLPIILLIVIIMLLV